MSVSAVKQVEAFYERHANKLPNKELVSRKTGEARYILDKPLRALLSEYNQTNPDQQVSFSSFVALCPRHVKTKQQAKYVVCLCEYCENSQLKVNAINAKSCNQCMEKASTSLQVSPCVLKVTATNSITHHALTENVINMASVC